jgi:SAM-dependent methyltransferase
MKNNLTKKYMWESKWGKDALPIKLDPFIRSNQSFIDIFDQYFILPNIDNPTVLEIGCSPGKFLIYFSERYGYNVSGIEYAKKGYDLTINNLDFCGVDSTGIMHEDIFNYDTSNKYDVLLSCGFIEHFDENLNELLLIHSRLVKKGGLLFLSFPNFRYLNYIFSYFFRHDMLEMHNLDIMNKIFFQKFSENYNYEILFLDYFGGIHPAGIKIFKSISAKNRLNLKYNNRGDTINHDYFLNKINSKYFSHYLGAVMKKL